MTDCSNFYVDPPPSPSSRPMDRNKSHKKFLFLLHRNPCQKLFQIHLQRTTFRPSSLFRALKLMLHTSGSLFNIKPNIILREGVKKTDILCPSPCPLPCQPPPLPTCRPPSPPQCHLDAARMEIRKYDGRTDRLTGVGARDTCVSKNKSPSTVVLIN